MMNARTFIFDALKIHDLDRGRLDGRAMKPDLCVGVKIKKPAWLPRARRARLLLRL